jgi:uncharacterized membrane protein
MLTYTYFSLTKRERGGGIKRNAKLAVEAVFISTFTLFQLPAIRYLRLGIFWSGKCI